MKSWGGALPARAELRRANWALLNRSTVGIKPREKKKEDSIWQDIFHGYRSDNAGMKEAYRSQLTNDSGEAPWVAAARTAERESSSNEPKYFPRFQTSKMSTITHQCGIIIHWIAFRSNFESGLRYYSLIKYQKHQTSIII